MQRQGGYREGITRGKEAHLQAGFDSGYTAGALAGRQLGQARGQANALLALCLSMGRSDIVEDLRKIVTDLGKLKLIDIAGPDTEAEDHFRLEHGGEVMREQSLEEQLGSLSGVGAQEKVSTWQECQAQLQALNERFRGGQ